MPSCNPCTRPRSSRHSRHFPSYTRFEPALPLSPLSGLGNVRLADQRPTAWLWASRLLPNKPPALGLGMVDIPPPSIPTGEAVIAHTRAGEPVNTVITTSDGSSSIAAAAPPPLPARPEVVSAEASGSTSAASQAALGLGVPGPSTMPPSRPLSEISENEDRRRSTNSLSHHSRSSRSAKDDEKRSSRTTSRPGSRAASRPTSLVLDDAAANKRLSGHIQTLTLNLNDYAAAVKRPPSAISNKSRDSLVAVNSGPSTPGGRSVSAGAVLGGPSKPERPTLALRTTSISSIKEVKKEEDDGVELASPKSPS